MSEGPRQAVRYIPGRHHSLSLSNTLNNPAPCAVRAIPLRLLGEVMQQIPVRVVY